MAFQKGHKVNQGRKPTNAFKKGIEHPWYGKRLPEAWVKAAADGLRGKKRKPFSEQARINMGLAHKGKKLPPRTEEFKRKLSIARTGKKMSEETKLKISVSSLIMGERYVCHAIGALKHMVLKCKNTQMQYDYS